MKILQLCKKFPYPVMDGESIAITNLAKAFRQLGCEVHLLAMNTHKHWADVGEHLDALKQYSRVETATVDNRIKPWNAFLNLFGQESYHIERFVSRIFEEQLRRMLTTENYDVIQLETLYLAPYVPVIRDCSRALVAMRAHNVEHEIWERVAAHSPTLRKWYLQRITPRLKDFELGNLNIYDLMVGITRRDMERFQSLGLQIPFVVCPIGVDSKDYNPDYNSYHRPLSLSFIGSLDWIPNIEGLRWFLEQVWAPLLAPRFPELSFHIAGRKPPTWLTHTRLPRVRVHGQVPSAADFINQHTIMVVPLLSGSGMRAKALEGMALGKVVLGTSIGFEGIEGVHRETLLRADNPQAFADAVAWCYEQGDQLEKLGKNAQQWCAEHYDNLSLARRLATTYQTMNSERAKFSTDYKGSSFEITRQ